MAVNEEIVTGKKFRRLIDIATNKWRRYSFWNKAKDTECEDGTDVETKVGAIKGITTSTNVSETGYAADAKTVSEINQSLTDIGECVILGQTSSTSESNQIELPDDINNYKLLILMYLSTDGDILNTNIVPIKYFKQTKYRVIAIWTNTSFGAFAKYIDDTHINLYVRTRYSAVLIGVK